MKTVAACTLGCKVNQYETEAMVEQFEKAGYAIVDYNERADVYIINTCSVTNIGDKKSRQMIRRSLDKNPKALIAVTGCYSQLAPNKVLEIPGVQVVIGTDERKDIVQVVEKAMESTEQVCTVKDIMQVKEFEELSIEGHKSHTRAFIKIQEGCDNYCTYCIIPYARGHIRSRSPRLIIDEVKRLAKAGFKEIVLTGIHIGSYGKDLGNISLIDLMEMIHPVQGIERIRLGSVEPRTLSDDFIRRILCLKKVCPHFHLSLQSGCDTVLKRMNRKYTIEEYGNVVEKLKSAYENVALTTDIIVGFPGETEEEFEITKAFVRKVGFSEIHVFKYSPKLGTPAAKYKEQVAPEIKERRSKELLAIGAVLSLNYKEKFIGSTYQVLFEQPVSNEIGIYEGLTENYLTVQAQGEISLKGQVKTIKLEAMEKDFIRGKVIEPDKIEL